MLTVLTTTGLFRPGLHCGHYSCQTLCTERLSSNSLLPPPPPGHVHSPKVKETTTLFLRREYVMLKACIVVSSLSACHSTRTGQRQCRTWVEYCLRAGEVQFFMAHGIWRHKQLRDLDSESPATRIHSVNSQIGRLALCPNQYP